MEVSVEIQRRLYTAVANGEMGHNDMHGVGGDWLSTPLDWFTALLDKLEAEKEQARHVSLGRIGRLFGEHRGQLTVVVLIILFGVQRAGTAKVACSCSAWAGADAASAAATIAAVRVFMVPP